LQNQSDPKEDSSELEEIAIKKETSFSEVSLKELHQQLNNAVVDEKYELAAKIRDEISKRS
jgi:protein-arginine kinase activator protein McsA